MVDTATAATSRTGPAWWLAVAALLIAGGLIAAWADPQRFDWQPGLAWQQPWRFWSSAWVHWSEQHRWVNVSATVLVAALGWRVPCDRPDAMAWFASWPLTQFGLLLQPELRHYGGLSGVLHAGVVVAAFALLQRQRGMRRALGGAILLAVALKIILEHPWQGALQRAAGWDIAIAPAAHLSGATAGLACAALAAVWRARSATARGSRT
jgi:rhomboid family GlyGly-CTERM serine protease